MTEKLFDPTQPIYRAHSWQSRRVQRAGLCSGLLALVSALLAIAVAAFDYKNAQATVYSLAAAWAIGAPTWFFYEYFFLYRSAGIPGTWDLFKHGQQVGVAIWAGLTVSLTAFGTSDYVKPKAEKWTCQMIMPHGPQAGAAMPVPLFAECRRSS